MGELLSKSISQLALPNLAMLKQEKNKTSLINKLKDLELQAKTEKSHYYTAGLLREAIEEIERLEKIVQRVKEFFY